MDFPGPDSQRVAGSRRDSRRALTIGIDARAATEVTAGRGRVVREFLRALSARHDPHTYRCYARERWTEPLDERFQWELIRATDPLWHLRTAAAANRRCDVFLSSNSYLTVGLLRVPAVVIVYDLVTFDRAMRPNRRSAMIERMTLPPAVRRACRLVCISQATADAVSARFPRAAPKLVVAPLGVSPSLASERLPDLNGLPEPGFVLAVGTLEPRKNLPRLVTAYTRLSPELQQAHPLVVVGELGWETGPTITALRSLGSRCAVLGRIPDDVLAGLYRRCAVFCYPSLGEGFGLPVLEAMAAGAPVLTSNLSSLPEVGSDAVVYVDPFDAADITRALVELLGDERKRDELSERGRQRAGEFTWARFAEQVLGAIEQAAGES